MSIRVLITGATGFVGGHVLDAMVADGAYEVIVACRNKEQLPSFKGEKRVGDLRDPAYVNEVVKGVDVICHAAAWTALWGHERQSKELFLKPALAFLRAAKAAGVGKVVFSSTTSAAAPDRSGDAMSKGIPRKLWPHLCSVVKIENEMRELADQHFSSVVLRLGLFTGQKYAIGLLPVLLPRLKTHLVPWVNGGKSRLPLVDGRDIGRAFLSAVQAADLSGYEAFNIVGPEQPTMRQLLDFIGKEFGYPKPHFSVPFPAAYLFGWLMEKLDRVVPLEPFVTRSIIHLLEETNADNKRAHQVLGYKPEIYWKDSVRAQILELHKRQLKPISMATAEKTVQL